MSSRLLGSIDYEIATATSEVGADCARAKRVCFLIRVGRSDEANAELLSLRERYRNAPVAEVAARLNLAEGLVSFFGGSTVPALDKVRRAHAIAKAAGISRTVALSAAWLAHLEFSLLRIDDMVGHL
jgi:hypothetical protein